MSSKRPVFIEDFFVVSDLGSNQIPTTATTEGNRYIDVRDYERIGFIIEANITGAVTNNPTIFWEGSGDPDMSPNYGGVPWYQIDAASPKNEEGISANLNGESSDWFHYFEIVPILGSSNLPVVVGPSILPYFRVKYTQGGSPANIDDLRVHLQLLPRG